MIKQRIAGITARMSELASEKLELNEKLASIEVKESNQPMIDDGNEFRRRKRVRQVSQWDPLIFYVGVFIKGSDSK